MCRIWAHPIKLVMMSFRQFVNRLFPYLKSHIGKLIITSILMVFATALETAIPEITGQIVDTLFGSDRSDKTARFYSILLFGTIAISALSTLVALGSGSVSYTHLTLPTKA